jgi:hypothetical protein
VAQVLERPEGERTAALREALDGALGASGPERAHGLKPERTPAQWLVADVAALARIGGRLQARLWERPLAALGEPAARLVLEALAGLRPVLAALQRSIERVEGGGRAPVDDAR